MLATAPNAVKPSSTVWSISNLQRGNFLVAIETQCAHSTRGQEQIDAAAMQQHAGVGGIQNVGDHVHHRGKGGEDIACKAAFGGLGADVRLEADAAADHAGDISE